MKCAFHFIPEQFITSDVQRALSAPHPDLQTEEGSHRLAALRNSNPGLSGMQGELGGAVFSSKALMVMPHRHPLGNPDTPTDTLDALTQDPLRL